MFKSVVVATDGSTHSSRAVAVAADLAAKYEAELAIVHVLGHGPIAPEMAHMAEAEHMVESRAGAGARRVAGSRSVEDFTGNLAVARNTGESEAYRYQIRQAIGEQLTSRARQVAREAGVKAARTYIDEGGAAERVLERAKEVNADLIVLGSRGLSEFKGLLLGSVSHKVCQLANCTCVTVK